uniref:S100/CaBP-9k-type calcium binding subdomain domain-containing protein n=1 Tax=Denticeps clupeoides TaxID=299321 RepID=A0AAY4CXU1_9TELE
MAAKFSELELAINTLVTEFHAASEDKSPALNLEQFQRLVTAQLPDMVKISGEDDGVSKLLQEMHVPEAGPVTFAEFWGLVDTLATTQFGLQKREKTAKCVKCLLL